MRNDAFVTIPEFAEAAGITRQAVHKAIRTGRIRASRFGERIILIHKRELKRLKQR